MFKRVGGWIVKVIWPVFEPIIRWGIRFGIIGGLVWLTFYAEFAASIRAVAIDGLTTVSSDLEHYLKSLFQQTDEERLADQLQQKKTATQQKQKYDQCMKSVNSRHTSCLLSSWANTSGLAGNPQARQVCEDKRLKQIDRCEDRYLN
jgi:hypothetical protein